VGEAKVAAAGAAARVEGVAAAAVAAAGARAVVVGKPRAHLQHANGLS